ncbi:DUF1801 domain-containing protein [Marinilabiliaceae bacterium JC017]|nr:DUF1801 domain-containing protein [Marinilabiliaceae bacterium JC017]
MNEVQDYILNREGQQKQLLQYLHDQLMKYPDVSCKIRYRIPFYKRKNWFCYLNPKKDGSVEMAFTNGKALSNEQGLLDAKDRQQITGVTLKRLDEIPHQSIIQIIQEALLVDEAMSL